MKKLILSLALAGLTSIVSAQQYRCYSDEMNRQAIQNDPSLLRTSMELEQFTKQFIQHAQVQRQGGGIVYVIPVVFHILHNYGSENISDAQVIDAIRVMNEDYQKLNADTSATIPLFQSIAANCQIEFRLATIDPNGNCTNGIERIVTQKTYTANDQSKLNPWPRDKYLNIWTANSLENVGAAAYAYLPGNIPNASVDGVLSRANYVGSIGTSSPTNARTLTHEVGHCLNLLHPWGTGNDVGTNCGDDLVGDTPQTKGWTSCNLNGSVCNPPAIENVQNFMDYSYCTTMFTEGQKQRMYAALNSATASRNNLWSPSNLAATGTDGSPVTICAPVADFSAMNFYICEGGTVQFQDASWKAPILTWSWNFPGGTPSTSTDQNPTVTYSTAGLYAVTLTVTSANGTDSITKQQFVRVTGAALTTVPFSESFETTASFPGIDGYVMNPDNGITWTRVTNAASDGSASLRINNYTNTDGQTDDYVTPSFDLSNITNATMTFKVANAQRNSTSNDQLKIYSSINCGQSWSPKWSKNGATLSTSGIVSTNFTPTSASQWRLESVPVNSLSLKPNVRFRISNVSNRGNNTYIDEINITGTIVSVEEAEDIQTGFAVFPNPSAGQSSVQFYLNNSHKTSLEVKDLIGRSISTVFKENLSAGNYTYKLPQLSSGIYLINLNIDGKNLVRRLIVSE